MPSSHASSRTERKRGEEPMVKPNYSLLVGSFLWLLMMTDTRCKCKLLFGHGIQVNNFDIKMPLCPVLQKSLAAMSSLASSCQFDMAYFIISPACNRLKWLFQTHDIMAYVLVSRGYIPVQFLISMQRKIGNAPSGTAECKS